MEKAISAKRSRGGNMNRAICINRRRGYDFRTDLERRRTRKPKEYKCPLCGRFAQRGWSQGFCHKHALQKGCKKPTIHQKAQSQVERVTRRKLALEEKIIKDRLDITTKANRGMEDQIKFDEETELEGREDYEADYEKVLQGLQHPCYYDRLLREAAAVGKPSTKATMMDKMDNPMSKHEFSFSGSHLCELSDVPVAPPANAQSFHLPPKLWQQMHLRRLRKKTNVTLPKIDIWGLCGQNPDGLAWCYHEKLDIWGLGGQ